jgi:hypothetical protein
VSRKAKLDLGSSLAVGLASTTREELTGWSELDGHLSVESAGGD